jgi:hypothetical protein
MNTQEINKKFAELTGICWHEWDEVSLFVMGCTKCGLKGDPNKHPNPDFCADPRLALKVMMKREDWDEFIKNSSLSEAPTYFTCMVDTTGRLAEAAIDFLDKRLYCIGPELKEKSDNPLNFQGLTMVPKS